MRQMISEPVTEFQPTKYTVGALDRALGLLEALAVAPDQQLIGLAEQVGLNKATAFRHLKVLERRGYVTQDPASKRYGLGPRLIELGFTAHGQLTLPRVAGSTMRALRDKYNETVHLGVLIGGEVVHVEALPSTHTLTMASSVGERSHVHATALGKCLVAWLDPAAIDSVLASDGLAKHTASTITDPAELIDHLARVRAQGYAIDDGESSNGIRCLSAPIRGGHGDVIGAVSVSGPAERLTKRRVAGMRDEVLRSAEEISRRCGWAPGAGDRR